MGQSVMAGNGNALCRSAIPVNRRFRRTAVICRSASTSLLAYLRGKDMPRRHQRRGFADWRQSETQDSSGKTLTIVFVERLGFFGREETTVRNTSRQAIPIVGWEEKPRHGGGWVLFASRFHGDTSPPMQYRRSRPRRKILPSETAGDANIRSGISFTARGRYSLAASTTVQRPEVSRK